MQFALFSQKGVIIVESPIVYPLMIKRLDWMTDLQGPELNQITF